MDIMGGLTGAWSNSFHWVWQRTEAGWNSGSDIPSPAQAVLPCAQFTPSRKCSPITEEFNPFVPGRAPGGWFGLPEKSNELKP